MKTDFICDEKIENAVLSCLIYDTSDYYLYEPNSGLFTGERVPVYLALKKLILEGAEVDYIALCTELKGVVLPSAVSYITDTPVSHNPEYHIKQLEKIKARRDMARAYSVGLQMCESGAEPAEIEASVKKGINNIERTTAKELSDISPDVMNDIAAEAEGKRSIGIKSRIKPIDDATGGFEGGEFIVIAGRPGMGKTSLMMNMAKNFGFDKIPGIVFSLEMSAQQLARRLACDFGSISSDMVFKGGFRDLYIEDKEKYGKAIGRFNQIMNEVSNLPILIDDSANLTIDNIYSRSKKAQNTHGIKYVVIDHLGLLNGWTKEGQSPKNDITRTIKVMAKDLNVPVFVLCQMNRNIEGRAEQIPRMSDLRDSGSIEQDADIVMFPVVPGELGKTEGDEGYPAFVQIGKNRRGAKGPAKHLYWQGHFYRYSYRVQN